jgi:glucose/mannose-6-phosphate isomerase
MDLNDIHQMKSIDKEDMLTHIEALPDQLLTSYTCGLKKPLPEWDRPSAIVVAGMGGSAIAADFLSAYLRPLCPIPVVVHRDYDLPAWAKNPETLVICSSHSGNTEETLTAFHAARAAGCKLLCISTGGKLSDLAAEYDVMLWTFVHKGQPRAAVGLSFGLLLAVVYRLGLIPNPEAELKQAVADMREQQRTIEVTSPVAQNPAKRLAGQLVGRMVTVVGSGLMAPVALRWKGQVSEVAKAWAQAETLPEADHNTLSGIFNPAGQLEHLIALFLQCPADHPRNALRSQATRQIFMTEGINTDMFNAGGSSPLGHIWTAVHFGDYLAYYLAMNYEADPTAIPSITALKSEMSRI